MVQHDNYIAHKNNLIKVLEKFVPIKATALCADLIMLHKLHLHIEAERKSKYGDYSPHEGKGNRITVNHNLSKFEFLFTFIHELAHHITYARFGANHQPHGKEWKQVFKECTLQFLVIEDLFPYDLKAAIARHMRNPKYSHSADVNLLKAFKRYDEKKQTIVLDELPENSIFKMKGYPQIMQKLNKLRTYYLCLDTATGKKYRVHAMAEVEKV